MTTGLVDIRGVTPTGGGTDRDGLTGLTTDTVGVCPTSTGGSWQFTVRSLGDGRVAYVSNGSLGVTSTHPSWETTTAGGAGAYNGALRNFVFNSRGASVLFVSDAATDTNIAPALEADDHLVDTVLNDFSAGSNPALRADLSDYDAVVWSATGAGAGAAHTDAMVFSNLTSFATTGGLVLVVGYDAIADPADPMLVSFLGGTGSSNTTAAPGPISGTVNVLTVGAIDIRGLTPSGGSADRDGLSGASASTEAVSESGAVAQWTVRQVGLGRVAFISNGDAGPTSAHPSWTNTAAGGAGAYNAALRNFAYAALNGLPGSGNLGAGCSVDTECASNFCVDGVCCDGACGGGALGDCLACAQAAGAAFDGLCGALDARTAVRTVCRPATDLCDFPETCVAGSTSCPSDGLQPGTHVCRAARGPCDARETCSGTSAACPADAPAAAGTTCRPAAGACDVEETCNGTSTTCPANVLVVAETECRAAAGPCDVAEACSGAAPTCPPDRFAGPARECRGSAGACDAAEACDGLGASCPTDAPAPDGTGCSDSMMCNGAEMCVGGVCMSPGSPCDDGNPCTADVCSESEGCSTSPVDGCCRTASDCADGDPCTRDLCVDGNVCVHDPDPTCGADGGPIGRDSGVGDAGAGGDAGDTDAGTRPPPVDDGCGCSAPGSSAPPLGTLLLVGIVLGWLGRRRR
jgi:uncharacterized protein (TIGR03382 family)